MKAGRDSGGSVSSWSLLFGGDQRRVQAETPLIVLCGYSRPPLFAQAGSGGTLTVSDGTHSRPFSLTGSYNTAGFHIASDNHGGTAVTFS